MTIKHLLPIIAGVSVLLLGAVAVGFVAITGLVASDPPPAPQPARTVTVPTAIPDGHSRVTQCCTDNGADTTERA